MELAERFWRMVDRRGPGECWPWKGTPTRKGTPSGAYGVFFVPLADRAAHPFLCTRKEGLEGAHRVAWALRHATRIPEGLCVLHECDNPACCNPAHLILGDRTRNAAHRDQRGRTRKGAAHAFAVLNEADVVAIRDAYAAGETATELGARYNVKPDSIYKLLQGKSWKHVAGGAAYQPRSRGLAGEKSPTAKLDDDAVRDIRRRFAGGEDRGEIAAAHGVSRSSVALIAVGKTWTRVV